jgi:hypothetical protein
MYDRKIDSSKVVFYDFALDGSLTVKKVSAELSLFQLQQEPREAVDAMMRKVRYGGVVKAADQVKKFGEAVQEQFDRAGERHPWKYYEQQPVVNGFEVDHARQATFDTLRSYGGGFAKVTPPTTEEDASMEAQSPDARRKAAEKALIEARRATRRAIFRRG